MNIAPAKIVNFPGIRLAALEGKMSFRDDLTPTLWRAFAMIRRHFPERFSTTQYSVSLYPARFFLDFSADRSFLKWAAAPMTGDTDPPGALKWLDIPPGRYAVFEYRGAAEGGASFFEYIFKEWLPQSGFILDTRPHFEILPPDYRPDDIDATEWVYIPVAPAQQRENKPG